MPSDLALPTATLGGQTLPKDHPRVEAIGSLDELNVFAGAVRTGLATDGTVPDKVRESLERDLHGIQLRLVDIGIALSEGRGASVPNPAQVTALKTSRASLESILEPAQQAILPGGVPTTARLHMCRSICDRAERNVIRLARTEHVAAETFEYLDQLSPWFMAAARVVADRTGKEWFYS